MRLVIFHIKLSEPFKTCYQIFLVEKIIFFNEIIHLGFFFEKNETFFLSLGNFLEQI